ncbi:hypothetical protein PVT71_25435 (plasmid) [Salipiger sp. H15]|uniref:Uncharacterized protein n=1 Tax=Alloyangia sp. H15 TaxID=3029062 RepID=A0AAU8AQQ0_9RHOB
MIDILLYIIFVPLIFCLVWIFTSVLPNWLAIIGLGKWGWDVGNSGGKALSLWLETGDPAIWAPACGVCFALVMALVTRPLKRFLHRVEATWV